MNISGVRAVAKSAKFIETEKLDYDFAPRKIRTPDAPAVLIARKGSPRIVGLDTANMVIHATQNYVAPTANSKPVVTDNERDREKDPAFVIHASEDE